MELKISVMFDLAHVCGTENQVAAVELLWIHTFLIELAMAKNALIESPKEFGQKITKLRFPLFRFANNFVFVKVRRTTCFAVFGYPGFLNSQKRQGTPNCRN